MKKFVAILSGKNRDKFSESLLQAHIAYLQGLYDASILELCGPFADDDSAMQIIQAENLPAAMQTLAQDPFIRQKYYRDLEIRELIEAHPGNNWLSSHPQTEAKS